MRTAPMASRTRTPGLLRRLVALAAFLAALGAPGAAIAEQRATVAVLPLVVHAMEEQEYLRSGLADMLASRLGRFREVGVIRVNDPGTATTDAAAARAVGREMGADWVLYGSFTRFGDGASLDLRCVDTRGEGEDGARSIFVQAGRLGDIIPNLDALSEKVARYVASGGAARPDVAAGPAGSAATGPGVDALRTEVEALRSRVQALEDALPGEPVAERDLGGPTSGTP